MINKISNHYRKKIVKIFHAENDNSDYFSYIKDRKQNIFNCSCKLQVYMTSVSMMKSTYFVNLVNKYEPDYIIESRICPDFQYIENTKIGARKLFRSLGIDYSWVAIEYDNNIDKMREDVTKFLKIFDKYVEFETFVKLFILTETESHTNQIIKLINHDIVNLIPKAEFYCL